MAALAIPTLAVPVLAVLVAPAFGSDAHAQDWEDGEGIQVYETMCLACHQEGGRGVPGMFPSLRGNASVQGPAANFIRIVFDGRGAMPGFAERLSDDQVAAVVTYLRTNWENESDPVSTRVVARARSGRGGGRDATMGGGSRHPGQGRDGGR